MAQRCERGMPNREPLEWRLLLVRALAIVLGSVLTGCSMEARYRIKTIVFTGVPPLHEDQPADEPRQPDPREAAKAEQLARQQQHREALVSRYWQHGPFAAGECGRCHSLDQSRSFLGSRNTTQQPPSQAGAMSASSRLILPPAQLCVTCHTQHGAAYARDSGLHQHPPADRDHRRREGAEGIAGVARN